jgi:hypothetical protein
LANRSQPSASRWRVGRKPTSRNIARTSWKGQPVRRPAVDWTPSRSTGNSLPAASAIGLCVVSFMIYSGTLPPVGLNQLRAPGQP